MNYLLNEGSLELPEGSFFDGSINILRFDKLGTSLVITRGKLHEGETFEKNFDGQLKKLESQMKEVRFQGRSNIQVGKKSDIAAIEIRSQYKDGNHRVYQYQLVWALPGERVMAMSYIKASPLGEAEAQHWALIKAGIDLS
jgi:hypothetical protein